MYLKTHIEYIKYYLVEKRSNLWYNMSKGSDFMKAFVDKEVLWNLREVYSEILKKIG